jgi:serine protease Do
MKVTYVKKYVLSTLTLFLLATTLFATSLRDFVCVVRVNLPKDTVKYLEGYRDRLKNNGYRKYASEIDSYLKGSFGSGFVYSAGDGKSYIITNRHVVDEAETVTAQFDNEDGSTSEYKDLKILAADEDLDIAIVELPSTFTRSGLDFSSTTISDGIEVWSAGFPGLDGEPAWQLGKGNISNSRAKIKELLDPSISTIIQHTAQVDAGNSGGPLLVTDSKAASGYSIVGINTWKATTRENTNFAIPVALIKTYVTDFVAGKKKNADINERSKQFIASLGDKDLEFIALGKYVSNQLVPTAGPKAFDALLNKSSNDLAMAVFELFAYDPIEGMRYSIAYEIWIDFQGKNGVLPTTAAEAVVTDNTTTVAFTCEGNKTPINSSWIQEQGNWRILTIDCVDSSTLDRKKKSGVVFIDPYLISIKGGYKIPLSDTDSGSLSLQAGFSNFSFFYRKEMCTIEDSYSYSSSSSGSQTKLYNLYGSYFAVPFSITVNTKYVFTPSIQVGFGVATPTSSSTSSSHSSDFQLFYTITAGLDFTYCINSQFGITAGARYVNDTILFSNTSSKSIIIDAGVRLFPNQKFYN